MKTNVKVCYAGSGVRFSKNLSYVFTVVSILSFIAGFILIVLSDGDEIDISLAVTSFSMFFVELAISAILQAISSIAKTALYKRAALESQYDFEEIMPYQMELAEEEKKESVKKEMKEVFTNSFSQYEELKK